MRMVSNAKIVTAMRYLNDIADYLCAN
jgi:hypothetical protein